MLLRLKIYLNYISIHLDFTHLIRKMKKIQTETLLKHPKGEERAEALERVIVKLESIKKMNREDYEFNLVRLKMMRVFPKTQDKSIEDIAKECENSLAHTERMFSDIDEFIFKEIVTK